MAIRSDRKREVKSRSAVRFGFNPNAAAIALHDSLADGQSDSRAGILFARMQTLEDAEDPFTVLRFDSDSVVSDCELPGAVIPFGRDANLGIDAGPPVFNRVSDQILKKDLQVREIHRQVRKHSGMDFGMTFRDGGGQIGQRRLQRNVRVYGLDGRIVAGGSCVIEKVTDELLHSPRARAQKFEVLNFGPRELLAAAVFEKLAVNLDTAQRFLQIVAGGIGELLEIHVGRA